MKRTHRNAHKAIWVFAAPLLVAILVVALNDRREIAPNDTLPAVSIMEAQ